MNVIEDFNDLHTHPAFENVFIFGKLKAFQKSFIDQYYMIEFRDKNNRHILLNISDLHYEMNNGKKKASLEEIFKSLKDCCLVTEISYDKSFKRWNLIGFIYEAKTKIRFGFLKELGRVQKII